MANNPPRHIDIKGQDHMLAYITPEEGGILQLLGGSGRPGPMGIPSFELGESFSGSGGDSVGSSTGDDNNDNNYGSYADDTSGFSTTGIDSNYSGSQSPTYNEPDDNYNVSDAIVAAMTASSPTGIGAGFGGSSGSGSLGMGLEDMSIVNQIGMMSGFPGIEGSGLATGVKGLETMQGAANYAPVTELKFLPEIMRSAMNRHARDSLNKGYSPEFEYDEYGNIVNVTGKGGPGVSIPGIGSLMSMLGVDMGGVTTTGYAGKKVDDMYKGSSDSGGPTSDIVKDARTFLGEDIIEDDKVVGEDFIDPELLKYIRGRKIEPSVVVDEYGENFVGASSAKPVDFSAIDRGLQKTQSGIQAINRYR
jgi:hypothetical protein